MTAPSPEQSESRTRIENKVFLWHHAGGVTSVSAGQWGVLATLSIPTGKKLRLVKAEGDLVNLSAIGNSRGIRITKAGVVQATALTGGDQPNPDIDGLVLENTSGSNETWNVEGRHGAVTSQDMTGWFTWVEVSD